MGDRWNMHNDEIMEREYRASVPWYVRWTRNAIQLVLLFGIGVAIWWWLHR